MYFDLSSSSANPWDEKIKSNVETAFEYLYVWIILFKRISERVSKEVEILSILVERSDISLLSFSIFKLVSSIFKVVTLV